jgi:CRISPR-associated protein Cmr2
MTEKSADFWKTKLAAYLHDSPSKVLDIFEHENVAKAASARINLVDAEGKPWTFDKTDDHTAAAADRLPFPKSQSSKISCHYDDKKNPLKHPFCGEQLIANDGKSGDKTFHLATAKHAEELSNATQPGSLELPADASDSQKARAAFFAHWRLWRDWATETHPGLALLPADTRIPDHTLWAHISVVSALAGAGEHPAILQFQLGPVQDFIAAARSTRDLWSGSYLLSWLMAAGLARLAETIGPDSVLFPNLHAQPLVDLHLSKEIWKKLKAHENARTSVWEELRAHYKAESGADACTIPNLPNKFLAIVPQEDAKDLAELVETAIRDEWRRIADSVLEAADPLLKECKVADATARFHDQVSRHLDLAHQITPFPATIKEALTLAKQLPDKSPYARVQRLVTYFEKYIPEEHRDNRYYSNGSLNNRGIAYSLATALAAWQLDATRSLRAFGGMPTNEGNWHNQTEHGKKDALTGKELMVAFGPSKLPTSSNINWSKRFKHEDEVGAITLIKRIWDVTYLKREWGIDSPRMGNTQHLSRGEDGDPDEEQDNDEKCGYFAVLAFDGDSIGKWVSGENTPTFATQISDYVPEDQSRTGPKAYFEKIDQTLEDENARLLPLQRPVSPSYHLQFSEALSNFATHCAPRIVRNFGGYLIYAGGDDVLALLPASRALACADELQRAFRGQPLQNDYGLYDLSPGFFHLVEPSRTNGEVKHLPIVLPGPTATGSVGIAIAHAKHPLQDVVREAQRAEKEAKKQFRSKSGGPLKGALQIRLLKRSGETIHWTTRFALGDAQDATATGGIEALNWLLCCLGSPLAILRGSPFDRAAEYYKRIKPDVLLSSRFPYRLADLLEAYAGPEQKTHLASCLSAQEALDLIERELDHVLRQQSVKSAPSAEDREHLERFRSAFLDYARTLAQSCQPIPGQEAKEDPAPVFRNLCQLLATAAFINRQ